MRIYFSFVFILGLLSTLSAQQDYSIEINAEQTNGTMIPLWQDHWEYHFLHGYGGNPAIEGPHQLYITDPLFLEDMQRLQPRYIRQSIGAFTNPPSTDYYTNDVNILKNLWTEFYVGPNTMAGANDLSNYRFAYLDSLIAVYRQIDALPFLCLDYMPFTLSSNQSPNSNPFHLLSWDNGVRNAPPADFEVYGRVMYQVIKYAYEELGVTDFEFWNEPDQLAPLNTFFFKGTADDLFQMYEAIIDEVENNSNLKDNIYIGCCSFAFNSLFNAFANTFLQKVKNNNTRMDFFSFHPYSDEGAGYDKNTVDIAKNLQASFVPDADLINAEWGRLNPDFGNSNWRSLEYGLNKIEAIIDMMDKDIKMAHAATLVAIDNSQAQGCCIGIYDVEPISPKGSAFAFYYLNRLQDHSIKLNSNGVASARTLAVKHPSGESIMVAFAAPKTKGNNADLVSLKIDNLPWSGNYTVKLYKVDEQVIADRRYNNIISEEINLSNNSYQSSPVNHTSIQGSGALYIWHIYSEDYVSSIKTVLDEKSQIFPNPAQDEINIRSSVATENLKIYSSQGTLLFSEQMKIPAHQIRKINIDLPVGIYYVHLRNKNNLLVEKLMIIE